MRAVNGGVGPIGFSQLQHAGVLGQHPTILFRTQNGTLLNPNQSPFLASHLTGLTGGQAILSNSNHLFNAANLNLTALSNQRFIRQPQSHTIQQSQAINLQNTLNLQNHLANLAALNCTQSSNSVSSANGSTSSSPFANVQSQNNSSQTNASQSNSQNAALMAAVALQQQQQRANTLSPAQFTLPAGYG